MPRRGDLQRQRVGQQLPEAAGGGVIGSSWEQLLMGARGVSLQGGEHVLKLIVLMVTQLGKYTKNDGIVHIVDELYGI